MKITFRLTALLLLVSICFGALALSGYAEGSSLNNDAQEIPKAEVLPNEDNYFLDAAMIALLFKSYSEIVDGEGGESDRLWLFTRYIIECDSFEKGYAGVSECLDAFTSSEYAIRIIRERQISAHTEELNTRFGSLMADGLDYAEKVRRSNSLISFAEEYADLVSDYESYEYIKSTAQEYLDALKKENATSYQSVTSTELSEFASLADSLYERGSEGIAEGFPQLRKLYFSTGLGEGADSATLKKYNELERLAYLEEMAPVLFGGLVSPMSTISNPDELYHHLTLAYFLLNYIDSEAPELQALHTIFQEEKAEYESKYLPRNAESGVAQSIAVSIPAERGLIPSGKNNK